MCVKSITSNIKKCFYHHCELYAFVVGIKRFFTLLYFFTNQSHRLNINVLLSNIACMTFTVSHKKLEIFTHTDLFTRGELSLRCCVLGRLITRHRPDNQRSVHMTASTQVTAKVQLQPISDFTSMSE